MMKAFLALLLLVIIEPVFPQFGIFTINFDDTNNLDHLTIDTISNPLNSWQIGTPSKILFGQAYSPPRVIATDTVSSYPVNDHSRFTVWHSASAGFTTPVMPHLITCRG